MTEAIEKTAVVEESKEEAVVVKAAASSTEEKAPAAKPKRKYTSRKKTTRTPAANPVEIPTPEEVTSAAPNAKPAAPKKEETPANWVMVQVISGKHDNILFDENGKELERKTVGPGDKLKVNISTYEALKFKFRKV